MDLGWTQWLTMREDTWTGEKRVFISLFPTARILQVFSPFNSKNFVPTRRLRFYVREELVLPREIDLLLTSVQQQEGRLKKQHDVRHVFYARMSLLVLRWLNELSGVVQRTRRDTRKCYPITAVALHTSLRRHGFQLFVTERLTVHRTVCLYVLQFSVFFLPLLTPLFVTIYQLFASETSVQ